MPFIRQRGKLEDECLTIIHYLLKNPYKLADMSRALDWTKERILNYVHPRRWKTITMNQIMNWRDFHWKTRGASYKFGKRSLYAFVIETLRRRPDGKWEYNRSKLPILRHYASKYGYGVATRDTPNGIHVEVYKICDATEKYLLIYNAKAYYAAIDPVELESVLEELEAEDKGEFEHTNPGSN